MRTDLTIQLDQHDLCARRARGRVIGVLQGHEDDFRLPAEGRRKRHLAA